LLSHLSPHRCSSPADVLADVARFGIALLTDVPGPAELLTLADALGTVVPHADSRADGVTVIEDRGATSSAMGGFSRRGLSPHTDRSGIDFPPGLVLTACGREPDSGGEALFVDGQAVYEDLGATDPAALEALGSPRSVLFGGADGHLGSVFSTHHRMVAMRLRLDNLARFAPTVAPHLPAFQAAIERHTVTVLLPARDGYVINNHRWLHGRHSFQGHRVIYRVIANPRPGTVAPGFRPTNTLFERSA
jgi:alpha-ketoglutarate-dependent taurine dioxygenase